MPNKKRFGKQDDKMKKALEKAYANINLKPRIQTTEKEIYIPKKEIYTTHYGFDTQLIYLGDPRATQILPLIGDRTIYSFLIRESEEGRLRFGLKETGYTKNKKGRIATDFKFSNLYDAKWLGEKGKVELNGIQETLMAKIDRIASHLGLTELIID